MVNCGLINHILCQLHYSHTANQIRVCLVQRRKGDIKIQNNQLKIRQNKISVSMTNLPKIYTFNLSF